MSNTDKTKKKKLCKAKGKKSYSVNVVNEQYRMSPKNNKHNWKDNWRYTKYVFLKIGEYIYSRKY